jgi:hypothetical protein
MARLPHRQIFALALVALGVLVWGGCGGGGPSLATSSMTDAAFAGRVEAICARGRERSLRFEPPPDAQAERDPLDERKALTAAIEATLLPALQEAIDEIYALGAPPQEKEQTEEFLEAMQQGVDEGEALEVPSVEEIEDSLARSGQLARKAGLESCIYG